MLPRILSDDLCSLNTNGDKLAFSIFLEVDAEGLILKDPWIAKTIIKSEC